MNKNEPGCHHHCGKHLAERAGHVYMLRRLDKLWMVVIVRAQSGIIVYIVIRVVACVAVCDEYQLNMFNRATEKSLRRQYLDVEKPGTGPNSFVKRVME